MCGNIKIKKMSKIKHLHESGRPFTKEEFIEKIKTDDDFAKKWGELGPIYGKQWREWDTHKDNMVKTGEVYPSGEFKYDFTTKKIDQIQNLINDLKTNPDSRRLMVNAWNIGEVDQMVLPPCHYGFQCYTRELTDEEIITYFYTNIEPDTKWKKDGEGFFYFVDEDNMWVEHSGSDILFGMRPSCPKRALSLIWNQRSVDTFLGLPFNIASYGLLLEILAKEVNMIPDELIGNLGDTHLYLNHLEQAKEQIGELLSDDEYTQALKDADLETFNKIIEVRKEKENLVINQNYELAFSVRAKEVELINSMPYVSFRTREPFELPKLLFKDHLASFDSIIDIIRPKDLILDDYKSHGVIKAPLSN